MGYNLKNARNGKSASKIPKWPSLNQNGRNGKSALKIPKWPSEPETRSFA